MRPVETSSEFSVFALRESEGNVGGEVPGLVTLLDLLRFEAHRFVALVGLLEYLRKQDSGSLRKWVQKPDDKLKRILEEMEGHCEALNLDVCTAHVQEIIRAVRAGTIETSEFGNLARNLERELEAHIFLAIPRARRQAFSRPHTGWESMLDVFPDAVEDIGEMNKCFALSRYTAAVFHSLLVVEHGLIALGHFIGVSDLKPGWDATYRELDRLIRNRSALPVHLNFNFLEQTKARLDSMKLAWRNKVNHAAGHLVIEKSGFSDVSAEEVIVACRSFMRHLAEGLPK